MAVTGPYAFPTTASLFLALCRCTGALASFPTLCSGTDARAAISILEVDFDRNTSLPFFIKFDIELQFHIKEFHDRMPVIVDPKDYTRWLEPGDPQQPPIDLLRPYPAEKMRAWRIGPDIGNVRNNRPDLIDPIEPTDPTDQDGLF